MIAIAISLGLGTMVGSKRIVVTVGERIGKSHLTYGQGASAELVAASTILLASRSGFPVSTTHVLSSGVAGTMVAQWSGLNRSTVRNIALAWVLTLPSVDASGGTPVPAFPGRLVDVVTQRERFPRLGDAPLVHCRPWSEVLAERAWAVARWRRNHGNRAK
jgi:hypothetical protein